MPRNDISTLAVACWGFSLKPQMEHIWPIVDNAIEMAVGEASWIENENG